MERQKVSQYLSLFLTRYTVTSQSYLCMRCRSSWSQLAKEGVGRSGVDSSGDFEEGRVKAVLTVLVLGMQGSGSCYFCDAGAVFYWVSQSLLMKVAEVFLNLPSVVCSPFSSPRTTSFFPSSPIAGPLLLPPSPNPSPTTPNPPPTLPALTTQPATSLIWSISPYIPLLSLSSLSLSTLRCSPSTLTLSPICLNFPNKQCTAAQVQLCSMLAGRQYTHS